MHQPSKTAEAAIMSHGDSRKENIPPQRDRQPAYLSIYYVNGGSPPSEHKVSIINEESTSLDKTTSKRFSEVIPTSSPTHLLAMVKSMKPTVRVELFFVHSPDHAERFLSSTHNAEVRKAIEIPKRPSAPNLEDIFHQPNDIPT
jgi:hypothetical protein